MCWRLVRREGERAAKVPVSPHDGVEASVTDPASWGTFAEALALFERTPALAGLGFVFTPEDGLTGVDVDDCRDPATGELGEWAQEIIRSLDTYAEVSPSGTGVKLILRGVSPGQATRRAKVEIYSRGRYFTLTGARLGKRKTVEERQAALDALYELVFGKTEREEPAPRPDPDPAKLERVRAIPDERLLELARAAANGEKFERLWAGDTAGHAHDKSAADLALCALLAYWTRADAERVDRLFRRSGLMRKKWTERRGARTYGELTVSRACAQAVALYDPDRGLTTTATMNDVGNVDLFVQLHGDRFAYVEAARDWLAWDAHRWRPGATLELLTAARDVSTTLLRRAVEDPQADADERRRRVKWAIQAGEGWRLANIEQVSRPDLVTRAPLNADPYLLAVANGVLDLRTGDLRAGRRDDFITRGAAVAYDPRASCPRFEEFLGEVFQADADLIAYLWRVIGYCLTGDTTERAFFIFHGAGRNGKSTLVETLLALLGQGPAGLAQKARFSTFLAKPATSGANDDVAALAGARLVVASEASDQTQLATSLIKELTGGDRIRARHLYGREFEFKPAFKLVLVTNHVPTIRESGHALWDRLHYLPFEWRVPAGKLDRALPLKLLGELEGILARAVRACAEWQRDGLAPPERVLAATRELRQDMDVLAEFMAECVEPAADAAPHKPATLEHNRLYAALRSWLKERGARWTPKARGFGRWLAEQGYREVRGAHNVRQWEGLRLKSFADQGELDSEL